MKNYIIALLIAVAPVFRSFSQDIGIPPSPNSMVIMNNGANLYTGRPNITVPITQIETKGFKLPIYLSYDASGNKVEKIASWVGLGWTLHTGGMISRVVRGVPDDYNKDDDGNDAVGLMYNGLADDIFDFQHTDDPELLSEYYGKDCEPDVFYYNIGGKSGKFFIDRNQDIQSVPYTNLLINYSKSGNKISGFTVVDDDGNTYYFNTATESSYHSDDYYSINFFGFLISDVKTNKTTYNSSWNLSKIVTKLGEEILFEYEDENYEYELPFASVASNCENDNCTEAESGTVSLMLKVTGKRLSKISTDDMSVDFNESYLERKDLPGTKKLESVTLQTKQPSEKTVKKWDFVYHLHYCDKDGQPNQDTDPDHWRIFLHSLTESNNGNAKPPYQFHYKTGNGLPGRMSKAQDLWGYYNGKDDAVTLIPKIYVYPDHPIDYDRYRVIPDPYYSGSTYVLNGADRTPAVEYMDADILERIDNPDGGYTEYIYGPHQYLHGAIALGGTTYQGGGLRIEQIRINDGQSNTNDIIKTFNYLEDGALVCKPVYAYHMFDLQTANEMIDEYNSDREAYYKRNTQQINIGQNLVQTNNNIVYPTVQVDMGEMGRSVYHFDLFKRSGLMTEVHITDEIKLDEGDGKYILYSMPGVLDRGYNIYPFPADEDVFWSVGMLNMREDYDNNNNIVREIVNAYQDWYKYGDENHEYTGGSDDVWGLKIGSIVTLLEDWHCVDKYFLGVKTGEDCPSEINSNCQGFAYGRYRIKTNVKRVLESTTERVYNPSGNFLESTKTYTYNDYGQVASVKSKQIDGSEKTITYKYPKDYREQSSLCGLSGFTESDAILKLQEKNIINTPLETRLSKNGKTIAASLNTYKYDENYDFVLGYKAYSLETALPLTDFEGSYIEGGGCYYGLKYDPRYELQLTNYEHDSKGNLLEYREEHDLNTSLIWGYNRTLPVATVTGADIEDIYHNNFEEGTGISYQNGQATWSTEESGGSRTGRYRLKAVYSAGNDAYCYFPYIYPNAQGGAKFRYSCWVYSSGPRVQLYIHAPGSGISHNDHQCITRTPEPNKWTYLEGTMTVPAGRTASKIQLRVDIDGGGTAYYDDLRLYPTTSQMQTATYDPLVGKTSETDDAGISIHYEYDDLGRIINVKNDDGHVLEHYNYKYGAE